MFYTSSHTRQKSHSCNQTKQTDGEIDVNVRLMKETEMKTTKEEVFYVPPKIPKRLRSAKMSVPQIDFPIISTEVALKRLNNLVRHTPIYKRSALRNLQVVNSSTKYCYKIDLDTFYQRRCVEVPSGQVLSPEVLESAWDVEFSQPELFVDTTSEKVVHSSVDAFTKVHCEYSTSQHCALVNRSELDDKVFMRCIGLLVYSMKGVQITPDDVFLDDGVNQVVSVLLENAAEEAKRNNARIEFQRLFVSLIPVNTLECASGKSKFSVSVYDHDKKVLCQNYPCYHYGLVGRIISSISL